MGSKKKLVIIGLLIIYTLSSNLPAQSYERPAVRPIPGEIQSSRYNLTVTKIKTKSGEAEKLAYIKAGSVFGVSRIQGLVTKYSLSKQNELTYSKIGKVTLDIASPKSDILRIENSKFHNGYLYTAITTKPDANKCSFLILVRQKYFESQSLGPATKMFQSDCDRSQNDTWGGGMAFNKNLMYLSIGENRISYKTGEQFKKFYTQKQLERQNTYFGKVISINLLNFTDKQVISIGHRNPTGLYFDSNSSILYASEFGAEGGDEINLILKGRDYGYPETSFGRIYDEINPGIKTKYPVGYLNYSKYTLPLVAYVPSINPVQLFIVNDSSEFKDWRKNLFVGCLSGKILRVVLDNNENRSRVILSEQIGFGARIRDLTEISNSSLLASTDDGLLVLMSIQNR